MTWELCLASAENMELQVKFPIADTLEFCIVIFCEHS